MRRSRKFAPADTVNFKYQAVATLSHRWCTEQRILFALLSGTTVTAVVTLEAQLIITL